MNPSLRLAIVLGSLSIPPAPVWAGGSIPLTPPASLCPVPQPGECVYQQTLALNQNSGPTAGQGEAKVVALDGKAIDGMAAWLATMSPSQITKNVNVLGTDPKHAGVKNVAELIGKICTLKAICFSGFYTGVSELLWQIDRPVVIKVHKDTAQAKIPIVLDFRGPTGEQVRLTTKDGAFKAGVPTDPAPCGVTVAASHVTAAGFLIEKMPGDGICDADGAVDNTYLKIVSTSNGGDGMVVNSDGSLVKESEFTENGDDGLVVNGDQVTVDNVVANANDGNGVVLNGDDAVVTDTAANGNGGHGFAVNGDRAKLERIVASYNQGNGVDLTGNDALITNATILNNQGVGVFNHAGTTGNTIQDSTVAGNAGGNIQDDAGTLVVLNVSQECPSGYTTAGRVCRLNCPAGKFDYLGSCVDDCPSGFLADGYGICRNGGLLALAALPGAWQLAPTMGSGCSLTGASPTTPVTHALIILLLGGLVWICLGRVINSK